MKEELKIKDVMVGDWVDVRNDADPNTSHRERITPSHFLRDEHWYGVELVPEILEKNGWVYNNEDEKFFPQTWVGGGLMLQGAGDCGYCIVVTSDYDNEDTNDTPFIIIYVHELQHALKLRRIKKEIIL